MKYFVFVYDQFYPRGGMNDCVGKTDTILEAVALLKSRDRSDAYGDIYDAEKDMVVAEFRVFGRDAEWKQSYKIDP